MSRVAVPAEKIIAVTGTYRALVTELGDSINPETSTVQAALIHAATEIAMRTDTKDMGLLAGPITARRERMPNPDDRCDDCGMPYGAHDPAIEH